jgi:hypothetical protein
MKGILMSSTVLVNPAAVLGYAFEDVLFYPFNLYRRGTGARNYEGSLQGVTPAQAASVLDLGLAPARVSVPVAGPGQLYFDKLGYDDVLRLAGACALGPGKDQHQALFAEQVRVAGLPAVPPGLQQAYEQFVALADGLFAALPSGLAFLDGAKAPCSVEFPRRSRALAGKASGIYLMPDPFDARYVRMVLRGAGFLEAVAVRDLAYDYLAQQGKRLDFSLPG